MTNKQQRLREFFEAGLAATSSTDLGQGPTSAIRLVPPGLAASRGIALLPEALSRALGAAASEFSLEGIYFVSGDCRFMYWNPAAGRIAGYTAEQVVGRRCCDGILLHLDADGRALCGTAGCPAQSAMRGDQPVEAQLHIRHRDGHRVPVQARFVPVRGKDGELVGAVGLFLDLSEQRRVEAQVRHMEQLALSDELTGIPNRRYAETYLGASLEALRRYDWPFGVLFIDVDRFKSFNDRYGHEAGDEILRTIAQTFSSNVRAVDMVGRWGGEEFVITLANLAPHELRPIAEKLRRLAAQSRCMVAGHSFGVTVSVGATLARPHDTLETLLKRADALMYRAKDGGGDWVCTEFEK